MVEAKCDQKIAEEDCKRLEASSPDLKTIGHKHQVFGDKASSETIVAVATAAGPAGVAIVRLSGPCALAIASAVTGITPTPRYAHLTTFKDKQQRPIDSGIVLYFKAPHSFTGEDVVEFQGHANTVIQQQLVQACIDHGSRMAHAGEFSQRAFINNKMDLLQAEALADLMSAGSEQAARAALRSLQGDFSKFVNDLQHQLTDLRVQVEAEIDFSEDDISVDSRQQQKQQLKAITHKLQQAIQSAQKGHVLQQGLQVVLAGRPNVGKSSLLNLLSGNDLAIVTPQAGTTRDCVSTNLVIEGIPVHVTDTAGLRQTDDLVERVGIERSYKALSAADIIIWVCDISMPESEIRSQLAELEHYSSSHLLAHQRLVCVANKKDLVTKQSLLNTRSIFVSCLENKAFAYDLISIHDQDACRDTLFRLILQALEGCFTNLARPDDIISARTRHLSALRQLAQCVNKAMYWLEKPTENLELVAEELRFCQLRLSELTGEITADQLLGEIFSGFCVGK